MKKSDCVFCKLVVDGNIDKDRRLADEDGFFAVLSRNPQTPGHVLIIPREHFTALAEAPDKLIALLFQKSIKLAELVKQKMNARAVTLKVNDGLFALEGAKKGHLEHIHIHIIPRYSAGDKLAEHPAQVKLADLKVVKEKICQ